MRGDLPHEEPEAITLHFSLSAFDDESSLDEGEDMEGICDARVLRLNDGHLLLTEPLSVTFFGPYGPMLNLGDLIEVVPMDEGTYRYVRTVQQARLWTRTKAPASQQAIEQDPVRQILDRITEAGGKWEWNASAITVQFLLAEGEEDIPHSIKELVDDLLPSAVREAERMPKNSEKAPYMTLSKNQLLRNQAMDDIVAIYPYKVEGRWVFDDETVGLIQEPFVSGANAIMERMTQDIPGAEDGFRLRFSQKEFPASMAVFEWRREEFGGNWYYSPDFDLEGWLSPALLRYFDEPPKRLYTKFDRFRRPLRLRLELRR